MSQLANARLAEEIQGLLARGRAEEAKVPAQRLAAAAGRNAGAHALASEVFFRCGLPAQAEYYAANAAALAPKDAEMLLRHGRLLLVVGKGEKAILVMERALASAERGSGTEVAARVGLAGGLQEAGRFCAALAHARKAVEAGREMGCGNDYGAGGLLAACLLSVGKAGEAFALLEELSGSNPRNPLYASGLALISNYVSGVSRAEQERLHARYGELVGTGGRWTGARGGVGGRMRLGIVSPDLRSHSVASFIEPFFEHYDRSAIELYVYQTNALADAVTARLRTHAAVWRVMDNISDEGLTTVMRGDALDVLMELSGHTHANCLGAIAPRVAPVQVTYLGYPNITGVSSMDFRVVDSITDPPGLEAAGRGRGSERLLRLDPCFVCYLPPNDAPAVAAPPCEKNGYITFASFNDLQKMNPETLQLWALILQAVEDARLVLKGMAFGEEALRAEVRGRFEALGVDGARIELLGRAASRAEHLGMYGRVDIGLDPTPYCGVTTTCEALYMGVPVVSLCEPGGTHASRVGATLLTAVGAGELIVETRGEYVQRAATMAADRAGLRHRRSQMRERLAGSVLCDGAGFAARLTAALREMVASEAAGQ